VLIIIIKSAEIIVDRIKRGVTYCSMPRSLAIIFNLNKTTKNPVTKLIRKKVNKDLKKYVSS